MKCQNPDCDNEIEGKPAYIDNMKVCQDCWVGIKWKKAKEKYKEKMKNEN